MSWPEPEPDDALLAELVRQGNSRHAMRLHRAWGGGPPNRAQTLQQTSVTSPAVFAPVVLLGDPAHSLVCEVTIDGGSDHSPTLSASARHAIEQALDEAWRLVGGAGDRPACGVRLRLSEQLALALDGSSFHLPALLAAVAHFSDEPLPRNVLATGHFAHDIHGSLTTKLAMSRERRDVTDHGSLLVATKHWPTHQSLDQHDVRRCFTAAEAVREAFGHLPWSRTASAMRLHFHASQQGEKAKPPLRGRGWSSVALPHPIERDALATVVRVVRDRLEHAASVELSLAGPLVLAAALGWELKNYRGVIVLVHDDVVWWRSGSFVAPAEGHGAFTIPRVLVSGRGRTEPGWDSLHLGQGAAVGRKVDRRDLRRALSRAASGVRGHQTLDLACDGPWPVAWAFAESLRNVVSTVRFHDWQDGRYVEGFSGTRFGIG